MSQTQQTASAQQAQNLNQTSIITYFKCDDVTICIVSIVSPDGKTRLFGNGIGTIVPMNRITKKGDTQTPPDNQKQYALHFENGKWNCYLDGNLVHTFDEIFGLPEGNSSLENISFHQVKYVPTVVDEKPEMFREILGQLVSAYPDRFCFEDPAKQKTAHVGGMKVRIPQQIYDLLIEYLRKSGIPMDSFLKYLTNGSTIGVSRGDIDVYVRNLEQANSIIAILTTTLDFEKLVSEPENGKPQQAKSNELTFKLYLDILSKQLNIRPEELIRTFNLLEGSDPAQCYIELEIIIATDFHKAYNFNCFGYFLGLLIPDLKISTSSVSLNHGCDVIPINVGSFDEFLKNLGINLAGIQNTREFIERLLDSPLISNLIRVKDILHLYKNIMGDKKTMHTSKPLRELFHLLVCVLKERRFSDQFLYFKTKLVQEMVRDEKSGQLIPTWSVKLFYLDSSQKFEVNIDKGTLSIIWGNKQFVSTGVDGKSLILSEKKFESNSGNKPLNELTKRCPNLFKCLKKYFDYLKGKKFTKTQVELFIDALGCRAEVCSHIENIEPKLISDIQNELKNPIFPIKREKSSQMNEKNYDDLMKNLKNDCFVQMLEKYLLQNGFLGTINSFVIDKVKELFKEYVEDLMRLSKEQEQEDEDEIDLFLERLNENHQKRRRLYECLISSLEALCMDLVAQYEEFYNSEMNWTVDSSTGTALHIMTNTVHQLTDSVLPYYLGTSVLGGINVHVFMHGKSGEVFIKED